MTPQTQMRNRAYWLKHLFIAVVALAAMLAYVRHRQEHRYEQFTSACAALGGEPSEVPEGWLCSFKRGRP